MEKQKPMCMSASKCCNQQLGFAILISFALCFVFLCFDYSALTGSSSGDDSLLVNNYANAIVPQNSKSHHLGTNSSDTDDSPLPHNPLLVVVNQTYQTDFCLGRYVYIHEVPSRFNGDLLKNCHLLTPGSEKNMCPYLVNFGFGPEIENHDMVLLNESWFLTNQFLLEVIFHERMKNYSCLTNDSALASAIYVPFYAGLDLGRHLWGGNISVRDSSALDFVKWVAGKPQWTRMWGRDHFLVAGRISWDFRRKTDNESDWGSKFRFLPESKNMSMLAIESSSWNNDYAIPYPTCFHPSKESEILEWQDKMRRQKRQYLFSFAGAPRPDLKDSIRGKIMDQCIASGSLCKLINCDYGATNCNNPVNVMKVFQNSVFCLQPPGDSYTRRSIFDAILAGCIPVFFHPGTAYAQYLWHLPKNYTTYSLYIPVRDVKDWKVNMNETLLGVSEKKVGSLREEVIRLIPRVIYADPRAKLESIEDAFDLAVKGILERIEKVRGLIKEGRDPSIGFADGDDFKYTLSPYEI
ncbi:putative Xyloglucan galactosyltransferase KATAMARI1 [Melia azedarach]|uniref:Xyloglucan galactosyltransferase KATAMARI1 n=1 Tax=Melia azedarach TaxID=155640 RepID=A0ACC1YI27_MELAZ|nr:putative Xyloglucan galactosyltransferase KATAMARI1 [Melia azedarach]